MANCHWFLLFKLVDGGLRSIDFGSVSHGHAWIFRVLKTYRHGFTFLKLGLFLWSFWKVATCRLLNLFLFLIWRWCQWILHHGCWSSFRYLCSLTARWAQYLQLIVSSGCSSLHLLIECLLHGLILGVLLVGGVLDLGLVTSARFVTTAIAREKHHIIRSINAFGGFRRAHRNNIATSCWVVLVHLSNSKAIVRHTILLVVAVLRALLESCILLSCLCSIHSRLRVLGGPTFFCKQCQGGTVSRKVGVVAGMV